MLIISIFTSYVMLQLIDGAISEMEQNSGDYNGTVGFQSIEIAKKVFPTFDNVFHAYLMRGLKKYAKKIFFTVAFFVNPPYPF